MATVINGVTAVEGLAIGSFPVTVAASVCSLDFSGNENAFFDLDVRYTELED